MNEVFPIVGTIHVSVFIWGLSFIAMWMKGGFQTMGTNPCKQAITSRSFYVPIGNLVLHSQSSRMSFTTLWCKYNDHILLKFLIFSDSFESFSSQTKRAFLIVQLCSWHYVLNFYHISSICLTNDCLVWMVVIICCHCCMCTKNTSIISL